MIRVATDADGEPVAKILWQTWRHLQARQLAGYPRELPTPDSLALRIRGELSRWLVFDSDNPGEFGFFSITNLDGDKTYRRWRFPEETIRIEHFAYFLTGEVLARQFHSLASHFLHESILVCLPTPLRDAYWGALKGGFRLLGESPLVIGTFAWLYLDRAQRFDQIQTKLRKAKIIRPNT
jgi:hypothetical protein